ncbi:MAG: fatty acid desaturase CarF family protein [Deltaproteobacteria bacterium]|nr:fatty acid desaturase CarF family protein [Deltaproteobacteria bacterium]
MAKPLPSDDGQRSPVDKRPDPFKHTLGHTAFELFGIGLALTLTCLLLYRCLHGISQAWEVDGAAAGNSLALVLAGAVFSGYLLADLGSGVVHFTFDRFFSIDTFVLGRHFVHPFRRHHSDPKDITLHDFIETNGNNCLAACCALIPLALIPFDYMIGWQLFLVAIFVFASIGTFGTNQFHKWAHMQHPPAFAVWLQQKHLILPRDHHQIHHTHPYSTHYCITTGWLNGILLKIHFWRFLELMGERVLRLPMFTEVTAWEQLPGSTAYAERAEMATLDVDEPHFSESR